jgi:phage gp36-like protein
MAYSTVTQVKLVLQGYVDPGPVDPDRTPTLLSDEQIGYEISNADEQINAVLRRRYIIPLPEPIPLIIRNLSIDIAAALADEIFRGSREYASPLSPARLRYDRALLILDRIAAGDYSIYNEDEAPENIGGESIVINPEFDQSGLIGVRDVFLRGLGKLTSGDAEYAEELIPYYPYLRRG